MKESPEDRRRYTDTEMALILRRAADLQESGPDPARQDQSHTLTELESVAAEVGIDPRYVAEAAAAVDAEPTTERAPLLGAPTTYQVSRFVEGQVAEADFAELLDSIRQVTAAHGEVNRVLGALEWKAIGPRGETHVTISPRQGRTALRIGGRYGRGAGLVYVVFATIGAGLIAGTSIATGSPIDVATVAAVGAGSYLAARTAWQVLAAKTERKLRKVLEEVTLRVVRVVDPNRNRTDRP